MALRATLSLGAQYGEARVKDDLTVTEDATSLAQGGTAERPTPGLLMVFHGGPCSPMPIRVRERVRIGRGSDADIQLDDASASRLHAEVEPRTDGLAVTDLNSHNGTFVDGVAVTEPQTLAPWGSVLRIAGTLILVAERVAPFEPRYEDELPELVGSASLDETRRNIVAFAGSGLPLLVLGETGSGKEVVARLVHEQSARDGQFVALNCAALASDLVESELFGHARGAFSGATRARPGLLREANHGTVMLDEVGDLPLEAQAKLLRAIETGEVRGVGEDRYESVDVRIVAATNRSLDEMVGEGAFRRDLLHRISGARIELPPLRARREDIPLLAAHFLGSEPRLTAPVAQRLMNHDWPGNVRELKNVVEAAAAQARAKGLAELEASHVDAVLPALADANDPLSVRIKRALSNANGNVTRAARELGMARSGLYEAMRRLELEPAAFRRGGRTR